MGEGRQLVFLAVVTVESLVGAHEHRAVGHLAERKHLGILQLSVPPEDTEVEVGRIHHTEAAGGAYPQQSTVVDKQRDNPVVTEMAFLGVVVCHVQVFGLSGGRVVDAQALAEVADKEIAFPVVGDAVDAPAIYGELGSACPSEGVVTVKRVLASHPVVATLVAVDGIGSRR